MFNVNKIVRDRFQRVHPGAVSGQMRTLSGTSTFGRQNQTKHERGGNAALIVGMLVGRFLQELD
eukprot:2514620-Amphidinium_carterae.3